MIYSDIIRQLRVINSYTQEQVADYLSICQKTYSQYECNNIRIPIDSLIMLAKLYNVDMNYICGLTEIKNTFPKKYRNVNQKIKLKVRRSARVNN